MAAPEEEFMEQFRRSSTACLSALTAVCLSLCAAGAAAQDAYPSHTVRLLVGFPPGGSTDVSARVLAQRLGASFGQPMVVENRAGAGGHVATLAVAGAPPDGYTLLWANSSQVV